MSDPVTTLIVAHLDTTPTPVTSGGHYRSAIGISEAQGRGEPPQNPNQKEEPPMTTISNEPLLYGYVGKNVLIRTVTNYYTGYVNAVDKRFIHLIDAAWIADTGRFSDALANGTLSEVEPYPGSVLVAIGAIVDITEWAHSLPRVRK